MIIARDSNLSLIEIQESIAHLLNSQQQVIESFIEKPPEIQVSGSLLLFVDSVSSIQGLIKDFIEPRFLKNELPLESDFEQQPVDSISSTYHTFEKTPWPLAISMISSQLAKCHRSGELIENAIQNVPETLFQELKSSCGADWRITVLARINEVHRMFYLDLLSSADSIDTREFIFQKAFEISESSDVSARQFDRIMTIEQELRQCRDEFEAALSIVKTIPMPDSTESKTKPIESLEPKANIEGNKQPAHQSNSGRVVLYGVGECVRIDTKEYPRLTSTQYKVIAAILDSESNSLSKDALCHNSNTSDAVNTFKRVAKKEGWKEVAIEPGGSGKGYRIL